MAATKRSKARARGSAKVASRRPRRSPDTYRGAMNLHGSANYASKLRESDVARARRAYERGATVSDLAARFGVNKSTMSRAIRGLTFAHVAPA